LFGRAGTKLGMESGSWSAYRDLDKPCITLADADDENAQAAGIAATIRQLVGEGYDYNDQCILCRTNAQADRLSEMLERRGIPVLYLGDLFARPEVKDMLSLLSLAVESSSALTRVAGFPEYALNQAQVSAIRAAAREAGRRILDISADSPDIGGRWERLRT